MTAGPLSKQSASKDSNSSEHIGLYIHVPFCLQKCPYCSFFSVAGKKSLYEKFVQAVAAQARQIIDAGWVEHNKIATIFVGGGTPSILKPESLQRLLQMLLKQFPLARQEREISIEVNPATVSWQDLLHLRDGGYNRISIGVQSLDDKELEAIGRPHTAEDAIRTIQDARQAGYANLNIDLMYGLPGQSAESWKITLQKALDLHPDHLAIYELTVEDGTPFARQKKEGTLMLPDEDDVLHMMNVTQEMTRKAGFSRYEISNYARPGKECRHNINYWHNGSYVGLGPSAVSCVEGCRYSAIADVNEFCLKITSEEQWWIEVEELNPEARFRETVVMGLRMKDGICTRTLNERFGIEALDYYGDILDHLVQQKLVVIREGRIRLTGLGKDLSNLVMAQLV